mmetsp:Transcript_15561/g.35868  ORF Transcript_15561/g.35868 Transcript_15561/m.35868 type:complete len:376 (-) Transcript_15561:610-1737(-)
MCGRAAQTAHAANFAARDFCSSHAASKCDIVDNNFNLSPGMDCAVMILNEKGEIELNRKKWGLIARSGTSNKPLYANEKDIISLCFSSLCYNARSDTLYSKPTFSKLAQRGRTCVIALDGYFEWKSQIHGKQPFFVYRKQAGDDTKTETQQKERQPLLIAGLWTSVATGVPDAPKLDTFAILTTEASKQIEWLHHRMPVCVWDIDLAKRWLKQPTEALKKELDTSARRHNAVFSWHKVTPEMSKLTFRSNKAIGKMRETTQSVKNFFARKGTVTNENGTKQIKVDLQLKATAETENTMISKKDIGCGTKVDSNKAAAVPKLWSPAISKAKRPPTSPTVDLSPKKRKWEKSNIGNSKTSESNKKQLTINNFFQKKK